MLVLVQGQESLRDVRKLRKFPASEGGYSCTRKPMCFTIEDTIKDFHCQSFPPSRVLVTLGIRVNGQARGLPRLMVPWTHSHVHVAMGLRIPFGSQGGSAEERAPKWNTPDLTQNARQSAYDGG